MQASFTGKEVDEENALQYYGARYYDNKLGKFTSIDPASLKLYNKNEFKKEYGSSLESFIANPQNFNGYSYSLNNPIVFIDPDGKNPILFAIGIAVSSLFWGIPVAHAPGNDYGSQTISSGETRDFVGSIYEPYNNWNGIQKFGVIMVLGGIEEKTGPRLSTKYAASQSQIDRIVTSAEGAYSDAIGGSKYYEKFLNRYVDVSKRELEKGFKSFQKVVDEHVDKLSNPSKYLNLDSLSTQQINGYIEKWKGDLFRNASYQNIIENILKNK